jgi:hypothetical protein
VPSPNFLKGKQKQKASKQTNNALRTMYLRDHNSGVLENYLGAAL